MTERIQEIKKYFVEEKKHHAFRREIAFDNELLYTVRNMPPHRAMATLLCTALDAETPVVFEFERIPFTRTVKNDPYGALAPFLKGKKIHEKGIINNICVD